jgi:hypothetical protein
MLRWSDPGSIPSHSNNNVTVLIDEKDGFVPGFVEIRIFGIHG